MSTVNSVTVVHLILPFFFFFFCQRYNPWWVLACFNSAIGNIFTGIVCKDHYSKKSMTNGLSEYEVQVLLSKRRNMKFQWWQLQKQTNMVITGGNNYYGRRFQICFLKCRNTCVSELGRLEASGDRYKRSAGSQGRMVAGHGVRRSHV